MRSVLIIYGVKKVRYILDDTENKKIGEKCKGYLQRTIICFVMMEYYYF